MATSKTEKETDWIEVKTETGMPPKLVMWRQKLSDKAKQEKKFRFYSLYSLVCHPDTLKWAWKLVRRNNGAAGVDGVTCEQIEQREGGVERFLQELEDELKTKSYKAAPVKRVYILKQNGKERPLGIPTIKDRVAQTAVKLIMEPIFEADFHDCSYGYRPERKAQDAVMEIAKQLETGKHEVYDADLSGYFDSIPHDKLMECIRMRIVDGSVLKLIRQWLKAPVLDPGKRGTPPRMKRNDKGTPQGGVISPLLANIYLHWFEVAMYAKFKRGKIDAALVRYADDFVILSCKISDELKEYIRHKLEDWMGLTINQEKTSCINLSTVGQRLNFLGYSFRYDKDLKGRAFRYLNIFPSLKSLKRERAELRGMTDSRQCFKPIPELIREINRHLIGWRNYYGSGYPRVAFRGINWYVR
jgi:RNA-directed DNA polymerase